MKWEAKASGAPVVVTWNGVRFYPTLRRLARAGRRRRKRGSILPLHAAACRVACRPCRRSCKELSAPDGGWHWPDFNRCGPARWTRALEFRGGLSSTEHDLLVGSAEGSLCRLGIHSRRIYNYRRPFVDSACSANGDPREAKG